MNSNGGLAVIEPRHTTPTRVAEATSFTPGDLELIAHRVAESRLLPGIDTPQAAFTLMLLCQAEGLHPGAALKRYHIIKGRPAMRADAMQAEFQRLGGVVRWERSDNEACSAWFLHPTHAPDPGVRIEWTIEQARRAGLTGNANWKNYPDAMLRARVISVGVRMVLPGVVAGIYTPEEVADFAEVEPVEPRRQRLPAPEPRQAAPAPAPPKPSKTTWDEWVAKLLDRWNRDVPAKDDRETTSRSNRIAQDLITQALACDPPRIDERKILRPSTAKGKESELVRDTQKVWDEARSLWDNQRTWVIEATKTHLKAKIDEAKAATPEPAEPSQTWKARARQYAASIQENVPERIEVWDSDLVFEVESQVVKAYREAHGVTIARIPTPIDMDDADFVPRGEHLASWLELIDRGNPPLAPEAPHRPEPAGELEEALSN